MPVDATLFAHESLAARRAADGPLGPCKPEDSLYRLYEQGAGHHRLRQYVTRWTRWLWGGLDGLVSRKGGVKHYLVFVLIQLRISGFPLPRR